VAAFIFDASAIVKRYLKETGSRWIQGKATSCGLVSVQLQPGVRPQLRPSFRPQGMT
jgi:hypothetical protein